MSSGDSNMTLALVPVNISAQAARFSFVFTKLPPHLKSGFIVWLARETGLTDVEITESLGQIFEDLFGEIEAEYGRVTAKDLDPRFVQLFLLKT